MVCLPTEIKIYILIYDSTEISSGVSLHMLLAGHA